MTIAILRLDEYAPSARWPERRPWVARITGHSKRSHYEREFVNANRDYSVADNKGRGIKAVFTLECGSIYEVCRWEKRDRDERYFVRVDACGEVQGVRHEDVDRILELAQCARDETIRRSLAAFDEPLPTSSASMS